MNHETVKARAVVYEVVKPMKDSSVLHVVTFYNKPGKVYAMVPTSGDFCGSEEDSCCCAFFRDNCTELGSILLCNGFYFKEVTE